MALTTATALVSFVRALARPTFWTGGNVGDGRERRALEHVLTQAQQGEPASVVAALDELGRGGLWFMHIGHDKGAFLDSAVDAAAPEIALEIGSYCGYSAVRIASRMAAAVTATAGEPRRPLLLAVEMSPENCETARRIVDHAGLSWAVRILQGKFEERVEDVKAFLLEVGRLGFEFVLLDHWKDRYLPEYLLLRDHDLMADGCSVFADNMGLLLGPKDFRKYLATHTDELTTQTHRSNLEYISWLPDAVTVSRFHRKQSPPQQQ